MKNEEKYKYRNYILPILIIKQISKRLQMLIKDKFGVDTADKKGYRKWLSRSRKLFEKPITNVLQT